MNPYIRACIVLVVLLCGTVILSVVMWNGKSKAEQEANEYRTAYEKLVEENQKAELAAQNEKNRVEKYQTAYNTLVANMLSDAAQAEKIGNFTVKVWHNAIWKKSDEETDKYTQKDGSFFEDFNDALKLLFEDEEYNNSCFVLESNQQQVMRDMKTMINPPEGYDNAFRALEDLYNSYLSLTNTVLQCTGSLDSFSEEFGNADDELIQNYRAAELYTK